ncbi:MAG: flagellar hook-basal body complex protein FliE [Bryobacteraceae bacterium]|jgi:flagellar hook-basal body complex protein FliE
MASPVLPVAAPALVEPLQAGGGTGGSDFSQVFSSAIRSVEGAGQEAQASVERFLTGEGEDLHTAALAVTRAEMAFDMFLQTRNKVVSAYQEIMRMQL